MTYKCKHFILEELVPPEFFAAHGSKGWRVLNRGLLEDLDTLRDEVFKLTGQGLVINNWKWGGAYRDSGLRLPSSPDYRELSGHSGHKAYDVKLASWLKGDYTYDLDWLQRLIFSLKEQGKLKYITEMELGTDVKKGFNTSWCHVGGRNVEPNLKGLFVYNV